MSVRAIIFDVYGTLLELLTPSIDPEPQWRELFRDTLGIHPPLTWDEFKKATESSIKHEQEEARACAIAWPEVLWDKIVTKLVPQLDSLPQKLRDRFMFRLIQLEHATYMPQQAAELLIQLSCDNYLLGIASNSQPYTVEELRIWLTYHDMSLDIFDPSICFWSYQFGFSKPDPHVFRILTTRLAAKGIKRHQILMVGDRLDNDIIPARAHGWLAWQITKKAPSENEMSGDWLALAEFLNTLRYRNTNN